MTLPDTLVKPDNEDSTLEQEYENWRSTVPLINGKDEPKAKENIVRPNSSAVSMTGIVKQLVEYSIETHSPIDCMLFMVELKKQASSLL